MNNYQIKKEAARQKAINFILNFDKNNYSYSELCDYYIKFNNLAIQYGLTKEFKANGII